MPSLDSFDDALASAESKLLGGQLDDRDVTEVIVPAIDGIDGGTQVHFHDLSRFADEPLRSVILMLSPG